MSDRVREILALLDERSARERFMVCLTLMASVFVLWNALLMQPLKRSRAFKTVEVEASRITVTRLETETRDLETKLKIDPNELNRVTKASLEQDIWKIDQDIVEQTSDLIPPQEMTRALRELLKGRRDLELIRMESLPPQPLYGRIEANDEGLDAQAQVYLHTVEIELDGGYLSALRYVSEIEALQWNLLWDELDYRVSDYPFGRLKLRVQSLSTREGWIGA